MKQSCWSCKHCINDYFATGTMDCKKQDDMTEDEFENYYGDNGGENCPYYEEDTREQNVYFIGTEQRILKQIAENVICFFNGRTEVNEYGHREKIL